MEFFVCKFNYWVYITLMMIGLYAMMGKRNLVKKLVGMNIFQTAIILYFISIAAKKDATIPILEHGHEKTVYAIHASQYVNPLPHVLMLTAIVVLVSTFGVALAIVIMIHKRYKTLEEDEILELDR